MVKLHPVMACNQLGRIVRLPTLFPTLVALLPALAHSAVLVYTLARACATDLLLRICWNRLSLNQYVDPTSLLPNHRQGLLARVVQFASDPARLLKRAGSQN